VSSKKDNFMRKLMLFWKLSRCRFDLAIDLSCDYALRSAFFTFLSGARLRVGYDIFGRGIFFNVPVEYSRSRIHIREVMFGLLRETGLASSNPGLGLAASVQAKESVSRFLSAQGIAGEAKFVVIHPGGHYSAQCWPLERFTEVSDFIIKNYAVKVIFSFGPGETRLERETQARAKFKPVIFSGHPLEEFIALIAMADLLICNNSGPLHIASSFSIPTVSSIGPTLEYRWRPLGEGNIVIKKDLSCMPCYNGYCLRKSNECLRLIKAEEMIRAVKIQLSGIFPQPEERVLFYV
jgi:heptosyltransferase-2